MQAAAQQAFQRYSLMDAIPDPRKTDVSTTGELFGSCAPASQCCCPRPHCVQG